MGGLVDSLFIRSGSAGSSGAKRRRDIYDFTHFLRLHSKRDVRSHFESRGSASPRDLLLWGFTASTVCATSAYKLGDFTGTVLTSVYALLLAVFSWSLAESRTTYIVGLLLRCVLCAAVAGLVGMGFTGLIHSQGWKRQPFVTIFPVSSAAFSGFLFALLTNPRPDLLFGYSVSKQWLLTTVCTAFLAFSGYMLLPEQLHRAWGLATTPRPLVGGLIGASLAILRPLPLAVSVRV